MPGVLGGSLGHYEIQSLLGEGGMGQVYRARDAKLGRAVAIKVVPDAFKGDADRAARFEREARLLAALNHANIAALYGLEEVGGHRFLVLELVEGDTLADRLARGPLRIEDALRVALQIADALEAAHEKGIIHRDLKPANVKLTVDDKVKVLDFGLAKAIAADSALAGITHSPTVSIAATSAGVVLGTAAYMSPEQAKGLAADHRSDIFSFGVVLHEMLTGRRPFQGETAAEIMAAVIARETDLSGLPPDLNPRLVELLKRCLEKNPKKRWHAVGDVRAELEVIATAPRSALQRPPDRPAIPLSRRHVLIPAAAGIAGFALGALGVYGTLDTLEAPGVLRFTVPLGKGQVLSGTSRQAVSIAPDGSKLAYVANGQLYLREFSSNEARPIAGTATPRGVLSSPVFSPDGRSLAYFDAEDQALKRIPVSGGAPLTICSATIPYGLSWNRGGLVFGQGGQGILRVGENGGTPEVLIGATADELAYGPQILPDTKTVLFTLARGIQPDRWEKASIVVQRIGTDERTVLAENGSDGRYLNSGHVVFARGGVLLAQPLNTDRLRATGGPVPVLEGVRRPALATTQTGAAQFSVSENGSVVYVPGPVNPLAGSQELALVDRATGTLQSLKLPAGRYDHVRVSPKGGRHIVFGADDGKEAAIYTYALDRSSSMQRRTFGGNNRHPIWSADGLRITFQSDREGDAGIFWQAADGSGTAERLTRASQGTRHIPDSWSPSGDTLLFTAENTVSNQTAAPDSGPSGYSLWVLSLTDRRTTRMTGINSITPIGAMFAPDGKWFAYSTRGPGKAQNTTFVEPYPPTGAKYEIPQNDDNHHPIWTGDGKELFVTPGPQRLNVVLFQTRPTFMVNSIMSVAAGTSVSTSPQISRNHDVLNDAKQFVSVIDLADQPGTPNNPDQINVILNWFEELKTRVPIQ